MILLTFLGKYGDWKYDEENSEDYCAYTPFMFSFVVLILQWILKPIAFVATYFICYQSDFLNTYL